MAGAMEAAVVANSQREQEEALAKAAQAAALRVRFLQTTANK